MPGSRISDGIGSANGASVNGHAPVGHNMEYGDISYIHSSNRPDEWRIEQGMAGAELPVLDMTGPTTIPLSPQIFGELTKDKAAIQAVGDRNKLFTRERKGWIG